MLGESIISSSTAADTADKVIQRTKSSIHDLGALSGRRSKPDQYFPSVIPSKLLHQLERNSTGVLGLLACAERRPSAHCVGLSAEAFWIQVLTGSLASLAGTARGLYTSVVRMLRSK